MGSKQSKKTKKSSGAASTSYAMDPDDRSFTLDSYPLDEEPTEEELKELFKAVKVTEESMRRHGYGSNRLDVKTAMDGTSVVVHRGRRLALLANSIVVKTYGDSKYVVVVILDTERPAGDSKRIGTLLFSGSKLPCDLRNLFATQWLPEPVFNEGKVNMHFGLVQSVPYSKLPKTSVLHRMPAENWERYKAERSHWIWRGTEVNAGGARSPGEKKETPKSKDSKAKIIVPPHGGQCAILQTLVEEQKNYSSNLSKLPVEIVYHIYSFVFEWMMSTSHIERKGIFASVVARVNFPAFTGINCNMMPIRLGDADTIPENMRQYVPLLAACPLNRSEHRKIGYLTIHESTIETEGASQRRGGVHTETPGVIWHEANRDVSLPDDVEGTWEVQQWVPMTVAWGRGCYDDSLGKHYEYIGGLYMASNVAGSCRVWNCRINDPGKVVGPLGDLEHVRSVLGEGETLDAGEVVWMTDSTPHESLPLPAGTKRQYFRLVTSEVSVWYADHSTPNPLGIVPPDDVVILHGNKFEMAEAGETIARRTNKREAI